MNYGHYLDKVIKLGFQIKTASSHWEASPEPGNTDLDFPFRGPSIDDNLISLENYDNSIKLDTALKSQFERAFEAEFSVVRIHTGAYAEELTRQSGTEAVTIGPDIYFGSGKYSPETEEGLKLLAHELQHVIQNQRGDRITYREDIDAAEREADKIENLISMPQLIDPGIGKTNMLSPAPMPFPDTGDTGKNKAQALEKSAATSGSLDDFSTSSKGTKYAYLLKDGRAL